jgi:Ca2+-dependent lipid-binding protein
LRHPGWQLENEILRVRVYDWDFFSADDLIGQADVPLNGLLEYGQVEVELTLDLPDTTQKKVRGKHPKKTVPAGRLSGQILFEGRLPAYNQLGGGMVERKHGVVYLAVRLQNASKVHSPA